MPCQSGTWTPTQVKGSSTTGSATWTVVDTISQPRSLSSRWRNLSSITSVRTTAGYESVVSDWQAGSLSESCLRLPVVSDAMQAIPMACAQSWWSRASRGHRRSPGGRTSGRSPESPSSCCRSSERDSSEKSGWVSGATQPVAAVSEAEARPRPGRVVNSTQAQRKTKLIFSPVSNVHVFGLREEVMPYHRVCLSEFRDYMMNVLLLHSVVCSNVLICQNREVSTVRPVNLEVNLHKTTKCQWVSQ